MKPLDSPSDLTDMAVVMSRPLGQRVALLPTGAFWLDPDEKAPAGAEVIRTTPGGWKKVTE
jgi:hypothetical protein